MKVYFVSAGEVTTYDVIAADLKVPETEFLVELVAARSRGQATYLVWKEHERDLGDLSEQRWQTKVIAYPPECRHNKSGILPHTDPLWESPKLPQPGTLRP